MKPSRLKLGRRQRRKRGCKKRGHAPSIHSSGYTDKEEAVSRPAEHYDRGRVLRPLHGISTWADDCATADGSHNYGFYVLRSNRISYPDVGGAEAKTPLERMQMMGEESTVKNIGKTVTDNFRDDNTSASPQKTAQPSSFAATTTTVLGILANILLMIGLVIAVIVLISMVIGLIGCLFALIMFGTSWGGTLIGENTPGWFEARAQFLSTGCCVELAAYLPSEYPCMCS